MKIDTAWIDGLYKDLRYAVHSLVTQPAFTAMALLALVVRQNAPALLGGLAAGLLIAVGESVVLRSELHGLSSADPVAYLGVLLVMLTVGIAASALPARRAAHTAPSSVLHYE